MIREKWVRSLRISCVHGLLFNSGNYLRRGIHFLHWKVLFVVEDLSGNSAKAISSFIPPTRPRHLTRIFKISFLSSVSFSFFPAPSWLCPTDPPTESTSPAPTPYGQNNPIPPIASPSPPGQATPAPCFRNFVITCRQLVRETYFSPQIELVPNFSTDLLY